MNNLKFFIETPASDFMQEKFAIMTNRDHRNIHLNNISNIPRENEFRFGYAPFGTVNFVREYCSHMNINFPISYTYGGERTINSKLFKRKINVGFFDTAESGEFVKPAHHTKLFTGGLKYEVYHELEKLSDEERRKIIINPIYICEPVKFTTEYRFYISVEEITGPTIIGFSRYDSEDCDDRIIMQRSEELISLVMNASRTFHTFNNLVAFSVDVGYRPDIDMFDIVEFNDAVSLGLYRNSDSQYSPSDKDYTNMIEKRWQQILKWHRILNDTKESYETEKRTN